MGKKSGHVIPVTLAVDGKLTPSVLGGKTFQGIIRISGASPPNPDNNRVVTVIFYKNEDYGAMIYGYWEKNGTPVTRGYGVIFTNNDFSKVTITIWAKNDLMISAPAQNRPQALGISNELMRGYLHGYVLK